MRKVLKYDGSREYMFPNGEIATKERVLKEYPSILAFPHLIITDADEEVLTEIVHVGQAKSIYNLDSNLPLDEIIIQIERIINTPQESTPSPEERIAAALEFQNLMML